MPRYEYRCRKCDKSFEVLHGVNENVDECIHCGGEVRRVFHPVGIVFKGSGFYATDSRSAGGRAGKAAAAAGKSSGENGGSSDSDAGEKSSSSAPEKVEKPDKPDKPVKASS